MINRFIKKQLNKIGYDITRINKETKWPIDFEFQHKEIIEKVQPYTMTSPQRIYGLIEAIKYISKYKVEGDIVECGVWRGGSMLASAEALIQLNETSRNLFLYDTFEGMSEPTENDQSHDNRQAKNILEADNDKNRNLVWAYSTLETVKNTMKLSTYPENHIRYIKGKVEDTIPSAIPERIALLRLDTDWYESTKHELIHLFPRLQQGGVLIIDDYGYWKGARKAVDEYFAENNIRILLNRMDDTGRIAVKQ